MDDQIATRRPDRFAAEVQGSDGADIRMNGSLLVGAIADDETGEVAVGHWPDGEQWVELFRVPPGWTTPGY